ncbi:DUF5696 domain-containing protein [Paenibacillus mendelii]|uniref:DUF5696 domain-containing protein n=1 Tax=Paenibacillus mendelii TaxID=206163 RepID=A0ABV6JJJ1_9BACL|nr:DUF5696 domain-containing protein [Paenibacillus mendelii]MCQ6559009.1 DUF5696 domain-containing protein [Paenibacillus mendelii]
MKNRGFRYLAVLSLIMSITVVSACSSGSNNDQPASVLPSTKAANEQPDPSLKALNASARVEPRIEGMDAVLENDSLRLYISKATTEIAVLDKQSGQIWRSNPDSSEDKLATPYLKGKLSSQISFVYLTKNGQNKDYDSYNNSIKYKQFDIVPTDKDVTVTYRFGNPEKGIEAIPRVVSKERFEERLLKRLEDPADQEQLKVRYKFMEEQGVYERREIPKAVVKKLLALFEKVEYTEEDLAIDNGNGSEGATEEEGANPKFSASIRYTLSGADLVVSVDTNSITEDSPPYRIHSMNVLENFGAASKQDEGYIFLPDGSGTLIPLNNGKKLAQPVFMPVYGEDKAKYVKEKYNTMQPNRLPVFGMKKNDAAFLAIIEEGDGLAWLSADIAGRQHEFNTVSSQFIILPKDEVRLSNNEIMYKTPKNTYRGKLQIRYAFMNGEQANYSGMAAAYRSYLENTTDMVKMKEGGDTPFYLELTGSIPKKKNMLGFPYEALVGLTNLEQATDLVNQLNAKQIANIRLNYKGWFNNGLNHDFPSDIDMEGIIGTKKEWKQLSEKLTQSGGGFYPDVAFLQVYQDSSGFSPTADAAQYISRRYAKIYEFDRAAYFRSDNLQYYLLSPNKLKAEINGFMSDYKNLNPGSISLRDLGSDLYSDFRRKGEVTREDAKQIVTQQVQRIHEEVPDIMVAGGNAYTLPYASHVVRVPEKSNEYQLAGESVPFNQMVLHGYVDYAGSPYNLSDDQNVRVNMLRSLETGSNVYFSWIYEDPAVLKETSYSYLFSTHYERWLDDAVQAYEEVNGVLKNVRGQTIARHDKLSDRVFKTTYENGLSITVNYGGQDVQVGGNTIKALDYIVEGG